jgi:hypothetical protein
MIDVLALKLRLLTPTSKRFSLPGMLAATGGSSANAFVMHVLEPY